MMLPYCRARLGVLTILLLHATIVVLSFVTTVSLRSRWNMSHHLHSNKDDIPHRPPTVLVTGAAGYIGKHVTLQLLNAGYAVRASMRNPSRLVELQNALVPHLHATTALQRLSVVSLDLTSDEGWNEAWQDGGSVDVLLHLASPCPTEEPDDEQQVIGPAIEGALRAIKAAHAAGITRVIMTSSVAAVVNADLPPERKEYNESDWTDTETAPGISAYVKSKTLAERAVWEWQREQAPEMQITTILPAFVLGAPLDDHYGPSVRKVHKLMFGAKKTQREDGLPHFGYSCVDVRDVALLHVRAMECPASIGKRVIASAPCFLWFPEIAQLLHDAYPSLQIPTHVASNDVVRRKAMDDLSYKYIVANLDKRRILSNQQSRDILGMTEYRDPRQSFLETAELLLSHHKQQQTVQHAE